MGTSLCVLSVWWVIARAADGVGAVQHVPCPEMPNFKRIFQNMNQEEFMQPVGACAPVSDAVG